MIGTRLKQARKGAGLSLRALSEAVGLSHTAIDKYEKDRLTPNSGTLLQLAGALGVSVDYLLRPANVQLTGVEYRRHPGFGDQLADRITADVTDQVERHFALYDLLPDTLPRFRMPDLPARIESLDQVEQAALQVRDAWKLGYSPIPDLIDTLEEHGIIVLASGVFGGNTFSGLSAWANEVPVIIISSEWPGDRQRFTACHELGHLLLHGRLVEGLDEEKVCDRFAGAFLVPEPSVLSALGKRRKWIDHRELLLLKFEYGLSMNAWLYRARDCGVLDRRKAGQLFGWFKKRGWNVREPGDQYPTEQPRRFPQTVYRALAEDIIGESKAMELLAAQRHDLPGIGHAGGMPDRHGRCSAEGGGAK